MSDEGLLDHYLSPAMERYFARKLPDLDRSVRRQRIGECLKIEDEDGLNVARTSVAVGRLHARIVLSTTYRGWWQGETGKVELGSLRFD